MHYKVQTLDEAGALVAENVTNLSTLDNVIVMQVRENYYLDDASIQALRSQLEDCFPGRKVVILSSEIGFVTLVPIDR